MSSVVRQLLRCRRGAAVACLWLAACGSNPSRPSPPQAPPVVIPAPAELNPGAYRLTAERVRGGYDFRRTRFSAWLDGGDDGSIEARSQDFQRLRRELLNAERAAVHALRRSGEISDEVARRVERDLDLEDARLEI